jgi:hypothetical protein
MEVVWHKARFDWLAELAGATALGLAAGFAAFKLAPSLGFTAPIAMILSGTALFALGLLAMRAVRPEAREHALADIGVAPLERLEADEPLLLETLYEEPLLLTDVAEDEPLLLDDPLVGPKPDSRVVQLFASPPLPTPGQLKERIDRHLATGAMHVVHEFEGPAPDASDALYAALADLRSSLR